MKDISSIFCQAQPYLEAFTEMATADPARFNGAYAPNAQHLIARFRVAVAERAMLALHFESDLPAGFKAGPSLTSVHYSSTFSLDLRALLLACPSPLPP